MLHWNPGPLRAVYGGREVLQAFMELIRLMRPLLHMTILSLALMVGSVALAQQRGLEGFAPDDSSGALAARLLPERDALGLPGLRPRLTMSIPLPSAFEPAREEGGAFSWSLEAWRLNTASLAHIRCHRLTSTIDSYVAEDCRFVDQPVPESAVNLVQVRGDWAAAPGVRLGLGLFGLQAEARSPFSGALPGLSVPAWDGAALSMLAQPSEGLDFNVSFGIAHDRVGDFLVGLQLARYRQRVDLFSGGMTGLGSTPLPRPGDYERYAHSAQLGLSWRRGSFSGDLLASARDVPLYLGGGQYVQAPLNSFDLEFSWRALRNASITIGVSNLLDAAPRAPEDSALETAAEDPLEHVFGRITYVRYKHDL